MGSLIHCIYASSATGDFDESALRALLRTTRAANARRGVTGMLIHCEGSFFQVLEGDADVIDTLYATIAADPRHEKVTRIIHEPIAARSFGDWTMGYAKLSASDLETVDGMNDFFGEATCLVQIDRGRARKLLQRFASGHWRSRPQNRTPVSTPP